MATTTAGSASGGGFYAASDPETAGLFQVLNRDGELVAPGPGISDGAAVDLFEVMVRTRAFDRRATALRRQGRLGEYYGCEGQEALAGAAFALAPEDWIFTAYRDQPAWFARGLPVEAVLELWKGLPAASWEDRFRITRLNATIGTHLPHAAGFTYAERNAGRSTAAMVLFSDGATSESDFHSGLNFAGVWRTPTVFVCQNNQYAQSVSLRNQTAGVIASKAVGYGMPGLRVDGMDPLAMHVAAMEAFERARSGGGPTLIEMVCYRYHGHATFETNPLDYRPLGEPEAWMERDPIDRLRKYLQARDLVTEVQEEAWRVDVQQACEVAMDRLESAGLPSRDAAIRNTYERVPRPVVEHLRQTQIDLGEQPVEFNEADIFQPGTESPLPEGPRETMTHVKAIRNALYEGMRRDPSMVCIGEDIGADGGCFKATEGFLAEFGQERVIDSPLCETGIIGTAVGMALAGTRTMTEMQLAGFVLPAIDQILGHVTRMRFRYHGTRSMPILIRLPGGGGWRSHEFHLDSPEAYFTHAPGCFVVASADPIEAKGLIAAALEHPDPVVFLEPLALYRTQKAEVPIEHYTLPLGRARIARAGCDVTVVTYGRHVGVALAAAEEASKQGIELEVIDLRTLRPWDEATVFTSIEKTRRLVTLHDAWRSCGVGAEIAARVGEELLDSLAAPIVRVAGFDANRPILQSEAIVDINADWVLGAVRRVCESRRQSR
jgi:2-oxoisovalerate dehydrogenase E1 component